RFDVLVRFSTPDGTARTIRYSTRVASEMLADGEPCRVLYLPRDPRVAAPLHALPARVRVEHGALASPAPEAGRVGLLMLATCLGTNAMSVVVALIIDAF